MTDRRVDAAVAVRRAFAAWLAVLGLLVQLSASAACPVDNAPGALAGAGTPFPICHAPGAEETASHGGRAPDHGSGHHDTCPFCSVHCHASVALAPGVPHVVPVVISAFESGPTPSVRSFAVRVCAAASPRGPPALA